MPEQEAGPVAQPGVFTRRRVLVAGGMVGAGAYASRAFGGGLLARAASSIDALADGVLAVPPKSFTASLRRRDDYLNLVFDFYNLRIDTTRPTRPLLRKEAVGRPAIVVVTFGPQHLLEQAFAETAADGELGDDDPDNPSASDPLEVLAETRLAGPSRLAFTLPASVLPLRYDVDHLLNWAAWDPRVVPAAADRGAIQLYPRLRAPAPTDTALEVPWRLVLSPGDSELWRHDTTPITLNGRTDLWRTTLRRVSLILPPGGQPAPPAEKPYAYAIWTYDEEPPTGPQPPDSDTFPFTRPSLTKQDRYDIVQNTSVNRRRRIVPVDPGYTRSPLELTHLSLSALGAFIDGRGQWDNPLRNSLLEWRQEGTLGRDHYVRIVRKGFLFPFGHPCTLVKITERKFQAGPDPVGMGAYLRQRIFLVVRDGDKLYGGTEGGAFGQRQDGRKLPFVAIRCTTHTTPILDPRPDVLDDTLFAAPLDPHDAFVPKVIGENFRFHFVGTDWRGDEVDFTSACVYVDETAGFDSAKMDALRSNFQDLADTDYDGLRVGRLNGARVSMAGSTRDGDTAQTVNTISWGVQDLDDTYAVATLAANDQPIFHPTLHQANLQLSAVDQVRGDSLGGVEIKYADTFLDHEYDSSFNRGEVYLRAVDPPALKYPGQSCGAVLTPNVVIQGLSRRIGPVGGLTDTSTYEQGTFDPHDFFDQNDAVLLGAIHLADIVDADLSEPPIIVSTPDGTQTTTQLHFEPTPKPDGSPLGNFYVPDGDASTMVVDATVVTDLADAANSTTTVDGELTAFTMHLLGDGGLDFIDLHFTQLRFHSETGQQGTVEPHIDNVEFHGVLEFINDLKNYLGLGDNAPAIEVSNTTVTASVSLALPSLALGVFMLENLAFSGGVEIPFQGDPAAVTFGFSSRDNPFHLTVSFFGGGGWFGISLDLTGVRGFEIGLEFGASAAVDFGVASGEIHIWAGIYFQMSPDEDDPAIERSVIEGYVRAGGSVEVMGIASVSLEVYLGFNYDSATTKVGGQATLTLTVSVLAFSGSVEVDFQQYFGGQGDPTFGELVPPDADDPAHSIFWTQYCRAFAPVAANGS